jgi:hypothetical protein
VTASTPLPGEACRKLPIDEGGTVDGESFEGRVVLATGHDPEQGDGTYGVLVLDAPVCGAYALAPQRELLLGVLGGKAKWEELGAKWNGQRVKVKGSVRSLDVYVKPMRHLLLFVTGNRGGGVKGTWVQLGRAGTNGSWLVPACPGVIPVPLR